MTPLQSHKQLLIAESELNRAQLAEDLAGVRDGVRALATRARAFSTIASSGAALVAGLAAFRRNRSNGTAPKSSWLRTIVKSASLVSTLWLALRSGNHAKDETKA